MKALLIIALFTASIMAETCYMTQYDPHKVSGMQLTVYDNYISMGELNLLQIGHNKYTGIGKDNKPVTVTLYPSTSMILVESEGMHIVMECE